MSSHSYDWGSLGWLAGRRNGWGGGWTDSGHWVSRDLDDSVGELSQALQWSGTGGGGQNHLDVAGETLQEQLPEEGFVESSSVTQELMHSSQQLCGFPVPQLLCLGQLLESSLL